MSGGDLLVDGAMLVKNYNPNTGNHMGITLGAAVVQANPQTTRDIVGDLKPLQMQVTLDAGTFIDPAWKWVTVSSTANVDLNGNTVSYNYTYNQLDDLNNLILDNTQPDATRADTLHDSAGDDRIYADSQIDAATAIAQGNANASINAQGDNDVFNSSSIGSFEFADGSYATIRMRQRTPAVIINSGKAANEEITHTWRIAA